MFCSALAEDNVAPPPFEKKKEKRKGKERKGRCEGRASTQLDSTQQIHNTSIKLRINLLLHERGFT